ncbi:glycosyltransferase family 9 protein, partial [Candidatus Woesearchaeota archaeon]|nr:glycosyltransferase family 9 protein [Candidatus Woesearchaeota archaeon]
MDILIIKLGALGDVLRTTFVARGFKEKYPSCTITWLTKENASEILANNSFIDTLLVWGQRHSLLAQHFDLVLSLDDEEEVCAFASSLSFNKLQGAFLEDGKRRYTPGVAAWFGMGLLRPEELGGKQEADRLKAGNRKTFQEIYAGMLAIETVSSSRPVLNLTVDELHYGERFLDASQIPSSHTIIGINPGAGIRWVLKMLSVEKTAAVCNALAEQPNVTILLLGGLDERDRNLQIKQVCPASNIIFVEPTAHIKEFASIINLCDIMITADSLALHISHALAKYTLAFFGPTSPWEISTFSTGLNVYHE